MSTKSTKKTQPINPATTTDKSINLEQLIGIQKALKSVVNQNLPARTSYKVSMLIKTLSPHIEEYIEQQKNIATRHGNLNEETGNYDFTPESAKKVEEEIRELLDTVVDVKIPHFKVSDFETAKISPEFFLNMGEFIEE
jgi:hypothetical protein